MTDRSAVHSCLCHSNMGTRFSVTGAVNTSLSVCAGASKSRMSSSLQAGHSGWLGTTPKVTIVAKPASD